MLIGCCAIIWVYIDGRGRPNNRKRLVNSLAKLCLLVILASLFFLPYATWYGSSYTKLQIWRGSTTPILAYLQVHGLFLFLVVGYLIGETRIWILREHGNFFINRNKFADTSIVSILLLVIIASVALYVSGVVVAPVILALVVWSISLMMMREQSTVKECVWD